MSLAAGHRFVGVSDIAHRRCTPSIAWRDPVMQVPPSGTTGRPSGETKAGLWAVWATIRLWSLTLRLWWDGLTNRASQAVPREYEFESSSSLAHLGNSPEG